MQLVNSFVVSKVDYCNSLLADLPACQLDRVQAILNSAARLVYGRRNNEHVTPPLRDKLHWLRIGERVQLKCRLLVYKALNGAAPSPFNIADFCSTFSSAHHQLVVPSRIIKFGDRSFSVAEPTAWNILLDYIKLAASVDIFRARLKTFLFTRTCD